MKKMGYKAIPWQERETKKPKCANCGGKGTARVTFEDTWGKLIVTLCDECRKKEYEDLKLQSRLDWPAIA